MLYDEDDKITKKNTALTDKSSYFSLDIFFSFF